MAARNGAQSPWPAGDNLDGTLVPRHGPSVTWVEIDGECVLYDARTGRLHLLNSSASAVWSAIDGTAAVDDLTRDLAARFAVTGETMQSDLVPLLGLLGSQRLLQAARPRPRPKSPERES